MVLTAINVAVRAAARARGARRRRGGDHRFGLALLVEVAKIEIQTF